MDGILDNEFHVKVYAQDQRVYVFGQHKEHEVKARNIANPVILLKNTSHLVQKYRYLKDFLIKKEENLFLLGHYQKF